MKIPNIDEAIDMINQAKKMNPGPWIKHCKSAADNARLIAEKCSEMDPSTAFILGLLHDIGKKEGSRHILHIFDGYYYLGKLGYTDAASICLTHSFPIKDVYNFIGKFDCTEEEISFLQNHLK